MVRLRAHDFLLGNCGDENDKSKDGRTITQDCNWYHTVLAQDETNPPRPWPTWGSSREPRDGDGR